MKQHSSRKLGSGIQHFRSRQRCAPLLIARAIDALQPWPLLPVTRQCLRDAMMNILQPYIKPRPAFVEFLRTRLAGLRTAKLPSGWSSVQELIASLESMRDIQTVAFQGSAIWAANYYCAMTVVFEADNIELAHVRHCLAAEAASSSPHRRGEAESFLSARRAYLSALLT